MYAITIMQYFQEMRIGKECELDIPDDLRERPPRKRQTRDQDEDEDEREENSREEKMFEESDGIPRSLVGDILTRREVIRYSKDNNITSNSYSG